MNINCTLGNKNVVGRVNRGMSVVTDQAEKITKKGSGKGATGLG